VPIFFTSNLQFWVWVRLDTIHFRAKGSIIWYVSSVFFEKCINLLLGLLGISISLFVLVFSSLDVVVVVVVVSGGGGVTVGVAGFVDRDGVVFVDVACIVSVADVW
jgi:hypothetical protein